VTSEAFGRRDGLALAGGDEGAAPSTRGLLLDEKEVDEFARIVEETIRSHAHDFESRFVAETPAKLRRLPQYYAAQLGLGQFPPVACNAPWVSAVVEADGTVRPCYFHRPIGNIRDKTLGEILRREMVDFRSGLDIAKNAVCEKCVCTLKVGLKAAVSGN
jgi:MoaA/NifB/PqqE/SkfB family radical SAM enzyme